MTKLISKAYLLLFCGVSCITLSGCLAEKSQFLETDIQQTKDDTIIEELDDPDMQLVLTEEQAGLDEELKALDDSGKWVKNTATKTDQNAKQSLLQYDFPVVINKQVETYIRLFQTKQKKTFARWLGRSTRYLPYIRAEFKKAGLPQDLAYLAMIESGFNQRAYSHAHAVGLWQFIRSTGRLYNLTINKYVDERRDFEKSTAAAIAFLSDLYKDFGDWHLAVAAYNAGPGKVRSGMKRYKVNDFWKLATKKHLRLETKRYVPKLIAAIIVAKAPENYGFDKIVYQHPLNYDKIAVPPGMSLDAVALISGSDIKTIKELNPQLRKAKTPPNKKEYTVKIPQGSKALAKSNLPRVHPYISSGYLTHKIRKGDTIRKVCRRYNINTTTLLKVNNLRSNTLIAGTNLRIPYSTVKYQLLSEADARRLAASNKNNMLLHTIKKGETVGKIARKYGVPMEMIISWNGIKNVRRIKAGEQLILHPATPDSLSKNIISQPFNGRILAGTYKIKRDHTSKQKAAPVLAASAQTTSPRTHVPVLIASKKRLPVKNSTTDQYHWYEVQNGDSIWKISRKFKLSTADIRKWNNLKSNLIHPGNKLKLKKV